MRALIILTRCLEFVIYPDAFYCHRGIGASHSLFADFDGFDGDVIERTITSVGTHRGNRINHVAGGLVSYFSEYGVFAV